jgi:uncharacterized membrane protein YfcA
MQFYLVAITVVVLYGLSKGGFSGLGSLGVPILSLVTSPVRAAAIVLPILIVQDWVSVWAFRRDYSLRNLIILTPSAVIGVGIGWLLAARVSDDAVRLAIGVISILFVAYMLIRIGWVAHPLRSRVPRAAFCAVRCLASPASSATPGRRRSRSMSCLNI